MDGLTDRMTDHEKAALAQYVKDVQLYAPEEWETLTRLPPPTQVEYLIMTGPYASRYLRDCSGAGNRHVNRITFISSMAKFMTDNTASNEGAVCTCSGQANKQGEDNGK